MEKNSERRTLSYSKGMTNVPSDLLSEDSELTESDGFIYRDGEMKPVQKPVNIGNIPQKIMYVHKRADYENIIAYDGVSKVYIYKRTDKGTEATKQNFDIGTVTDVCSVGNTLLFTTPKGIHYMLFKGSKYVDLGTDLPEPSILVGMVTDQTQPALVTNCVLQELVDRHHSYVNMVASSYAPKSFDENGLLKGPVFTDEPGGGHADYYFRYELYQDSEKYDSAQQAIQGHVEQVINACHKKKMFLYPFFIRVALKLHDGTYAKISNPIICYPTVRKNVRMVPVVWKEDKKTGKKDWVKTTQGDCETFSFMYFPQTGHMKFLPYLENYQQWKDIVKEFVVFATKEVQPFKLEEKWDFEQPLKTQGALYADMVENYDGKEEQAKYVWGTGTGMDWPSNCILPTYKTDKEIKDELLTKTQFYKLFGIKTSEGVFNQNPVGWLNWLYGDKYIQDGVLENLEEQEQLPKDDYYGWAKSIPTKMFAYNGRLNTFGIDRYPFRGFDYQIGVQNQKTWKDTGKNKQVTFYTHIVSPSMDAWVKSKTTSYVVSLDGWLYYPDPNATEMIIYVGNTNEGRRVTLTQHPMLNGAYSFEKLPLSGEEAELDIDYSEEGTKLPTIDERAHETMDSNIYTSVVNNPFVFEASGDNTVGTGTILGIAANTEAVSQGQFGQYPLMVFTSEGIYGMQVNAEGLYSATYPISREVCLEDSPLVPTDKLVYFVSKKGLMAASGGAVACMSEQMRGRTPMNFASLGDGSFLDFVKGCMIAYDYRDSMLRIFGKGKDYQYIYNMADKTFSMVDSEITAQAVVNDYPDNLIQDTEGNVYSLTGKPDINEDENLYNGTITTRPLKLGGSMTLKSLRSIKNLRSTLTGKLKLEIWGSNNARNWRKLHSLKGKPWAYYTLRYTLTDFKACDTFAGTIVEIQNRRTLK